VVLFIVVFQKIKTGSKKSSPSTQIPKQLPDFEFSSGPIASTKNEKTPLEVFRLFFYRPMNIHVQIKGVSLGVRVEEIQAFIGINIAMGMLRLSQLEDYWSSNKVLITPWFGAIMAQDQFFSDLHLVDTSSQRKKRRDSTFQGSNISGPFNGVFPHYYQPGRRLSVDEMMIEARCSVIPSVFDN